MRLPPAELAQTIRNTTHSAVIAHCSKGSTFHDPTNIHGVPLPLTNLTTPACAALLPEYLM